MKATPQSRRDLLLELIRLPGVSATESEDRVARFIHGRLGELDWFRERPECLELLPTPLEGDGRPLHAVLALVKASRPTKRTIILTGHFDVVDVETYGDLRDAAFDPPALEEKLRSCVLDDQAAADLASGKFLFGRGSMDMKCGIAVEMELVRDFASNRELFDFNILFVAVPDEENASAGMRGAIARLVELQNKEGLEYLAAVNAEPTEAGRPTANVPTVFTGTVGKLMPAFLCLGCESHVGAYYEGLNASLLSSHVLTLAEGNPQLADPAGGECCPSWICLEHRILREGYSVTVPGASIIYFNCFATRNSPADVLRQMRRIAEEAVQKSLEQISASRNALARLGCRSGESDLAVQVWSVGELMSRAEERLGQEGLRARLDDFMRSGRGENPREAALGLMREIARCAMQDGPAIIYGFLPPYYPPRSSDVGGEKNAALMRAADDLIEEAGNAFGVTVEKAPFFTGVCDLSYFGFQGSGEELAIIKNNMPGWGKIYSLPVQELAELDVPIVNFGPSGRDPHKKTERLEIEYSLKKYPLLLEYLLRRISRRNRAS